MVDLGFNKIFESELVKTKSVWHKFCVLESQRNRPCHGCNRPWKKIATEAGPGCHATCFVYAMATVINRKENAARRELYIPQTGGFMNKSSKYKERKK